MATTRIRRTEPDPGATEPPPPLADGIGGFGWLALFVIATVACTLVAKF